MSAAAPLQQLIANPAIRRLMNIARAGGGEVRVVGGAVRDALLGRKVGEIDCAGTLPPEKMAELLTTAGLKAVPTGIEFGTITAVVEGVGYEITTLRRDLETDGRHAKVSFTDDWQADAARRDFTFNALYVDGDGKLYDYFHGQDDLRAGHVRFIGDACARIAEDVLRILRFFRFHAWFGQGTIDAAGCTACRDLAHLISQLSAERVWNEIKKLLSADQPLPTWRLMLDAGIVAKFLPEASDAARLESLIAVEKRNQQITSPLRRLAALLPADEKIVQEICQKLKLSKREAVRLQTLATLPSHLNGKLDPIPFRRALYEYGGDECRDAVILLAATHAEIDLEPLLAAVANWQKPIFPLQGQDLLKLGMAAGPAMGKALRALEDQWIASDFHMTRDECLAAAKTKLSTM